MSNIDVIARLAAGDLVAGDDGFVIFWPVTNKGGFTAHDLRLIADELDRRNAKWSAEIEAYFSREQQEPEG